MLSHVAITERKLFVYVGPSVPLTWCSFTLPSELKQRGVDNLRKVRSCINVIRNQHMLKETHTIRRHPNTSQRPTYGTVAKQLHRQQPNKPFQHGANDAGGAVSVLRRDKTNPSDPTETLIDCRRSTAASDLSKNSGKVTIQLLWKPALVIPIDNNRQQPLTALCTTACLLGRSPASCWSHMCE